MGYQDMPLGVLSYAAFHRNSKETARARQSRGNIDEIRYVMKPASTVSGISKNAQRRALYQHGRQLSLAVSSANRHFIVSTELEARVRHNIARKGGNATAEVQKSPPGSAGRGTISVSRKAHSHRHLISTSSAAATLDLCRISLPADITSRLAPPAALIALQARKPLQL